MRISIMNTVTAALSLLLQANESKLDGEIDKYRCKHVFNI
jgi:hypothetical protein